MYTFAVSGVAFLTLSYFYNLCSVHNFWQKNLGERVLNRSHRTPPTAIKFSANWKRYSFLDVIIHSQLSLHLGYQVTLYSMLICYFLTAGSLSRCRTTMQNQIVLQSSFALYHWFSWQMCISRDTSLDRVKLMSKKQCTLNKKCVLKIVYHM